MTFDFIVEKLIKDIGSGKKHIRVKISRLTTPDVDAIIDTLVDCNYKIDKEKTTRNKLIARKS